MKTGIKVKKIGNQIIVKRYYDTVPSREICMTGSPKVDLAAIKQHVCDALAARMQHCTDELDSQILPSEDKVFLENGTIYSPSKSLAFNLTSFEAMERAAEKLQNNPEDQLFDNLEGLELNQLIKALMCYKGDLGELELHYVADIVTQLYDAFWIKSRE